MAKDKEKGKAAEKPDYPEDLKSRVCALCGEPAPPGKGILVGEEAPGDEGVRATGCGVQQSLCGGMGAVGG